MITRRTGLVAVGLAAAVTLAACSSAGHAPTDHASASAASVQPVAAASPTVSAPAPTAPAPTAPAPATSTPAPNPCATNTAAQQVRVSVREQHLWMCAGHTLVRDTAVTTGIPGENTHTPTGNYTIQARTRNTTLTLISGKTYAVKYWIPFDAPLFGFHDASWQDFPFGSQQYRTDGSHGCVHMPTAAIAFLYRWVHVGATVRIRA